MALLVVIVVALAVAVIEAAVSSVELQREKETHCQQCRAFQRGSLPMQKEVMVS